MSATRAVSILNAGQTAVFTTVLEKSLKYGLDEYVPNNTTSSQ